MVRHIYGMDTIEMVVSILESYIIWQNKPNSGRTGAVNEFPEKASVRN